MQESRLCLSGILDNVIGDGLLFAFGSALLEVRLEGSLKVEGHRAETSSFEEKIKIHILLICL